MGGPRIDSRRWSARRALRVSSDRGRCRHARPRPSRPPAGAARVAGSRRAASRPLRRRGHDDDLGSERRRRGGCTGRGARPTPPADCLSQRHGTWGWRTRWPGRADVLVAAGRRLPGRTPTWSRHTPTAWCRIRHCLERPGHLPAAPRAGGYPLDRLDLLDDPHPARPDPGPSRVLAPLDPDLFWSLSFAISRRAWQQVGGFCEDYVGYGGEDTDFGLRVVDAGLSTAAWATPAPTTSGTRRDAAGRASRRHSAQRRRSSTNTGVGGRWRGGSSPSRREA